MLSLSHSKKEPLMPLTKLKETPGPKSITSEVRMYIIHSTSSYIPALFSFIDFTALRYFYVFESKDVQPVISVAAVSLLWDVSGVTLAALVLPRPGLTVSSASVKFLRQSLFQFFTCGYHNSERFSIPCDSEKTGRRSDDTRVTAQHFDNSGKRTLKLWSRLCISFWHDRSFLLPVTETAEWPNLQLIQICLPSVFAVEVCWSATSKAQGLEERYSAE